MNRPDAGRRILITGVNGFTGRHLANALLRDGEGVVLGTGRQATASVTLSGYRPCDLSDGAAIDEVVAWAAPDVVYHLAGVWGDVPEDMLVTVNVGAFARLRHALTSRARKRPVRMLVIGSAAEIGAVPPGLLPVDESIRCRPLTAYGASKHALVQAALAEPHGSDVEIVVARPFNLVGAGLGERLAPGRFAAAVRAVARGETDTIACGWLGGRRDYLDVADAVEAYRLLVDHASPGTLANVCSGRPVRTGDLLEMLLSLAGVAARIDAVPEPRHGDIPESFGSHDRLTSLTGWKPTIPLDSSLAALLHGAGPTAC